MIDNIENMEHCYILESSGGTSNRKLEHLVTGASDLSARVQK